jgi:opacity protein-like surface antigen
VALLFLFAGGSRLWAQATPTASRAGDVQIGIGYTAARPDYVQQTFQGIAAYADFDFRPHLGAEAEFHRAASTTGDLSYEQTYEVGGRYLRAYGPFVPYVKAMIGRGDFSYPTGQTRLGYDLFAAGAGADIRLGPSLRIRGEYEFQRWSSFPNGGLTPQLITFGVAYHFAAGRRSR